MADTDNKSAPDRQPGAAPCAVNVVFASATDAFGSALVIWILGGVAMSIAGSFAGQMIPSLPPGFGVQEALDSHSSEPHHPWWKAARGSAFALFFAIFFFHSLWVGFHGGGVGAGRRMARILAKLREDWFGLIVGNAISAWVAVLILGMVRNFSPVQMLWNIVSGLVLPVLREIGRFVLGEANFASLGVWFSWYGDNQMKLDFWIIYLSGAFDDLGVPNFKTLARWAWRRMQKRKEASLPAQIERGDVA
jgi:hypothetical protein